MIETQTIETEVKALEPGVPRDRTTITVIDQASRDRAMEIRIAAKRAIKRVHELCDPTCQATDKAHKDAVALRARMLAPFEAADGQAEQGVKAYDKAAEAARKAEQARLQALADAQAESERKRALAAAAKLKTPELREARMDAAREIAAPVAQVPPAIQKASGEATVTRWKAELTSLPELIAAAAGGNAAAASMIAFDQTAANGFARGTKGVVQVPGLRVYSEQGMSLRV
jgi:hypothetical protein